MPLPNNQRYIDANMEVASRHWGRKQCRVVKVYCPTMISCHKKSRRSPWVFLKPTTKKCHFDIIGDVV